MHDRTSRLSAVLALLATAVVSGAFVGFVAAAFIWLYEHGLELLWTDLPDQVGVDPYESWWIFAVPIVGGLLVGLGQILIGDYPRPIDEAVGVWRSGGQLPPSEAPKTAVNSYVALIFGGPVGFEAALTGLLGGTATFVGRWMHGPGRMVRQVWGAERIEALPRRLHQVPYWLAALAGLLTYRWMPFGAIDMGFRLGPDDGRLGVGEALLVFAFALVIAVPVALAYGVVGHAERSTIHRRSPIVAAVAGAVLFALLGLGNELVLFSGQQGFRLLPDASDPELVYIAVAKWAALVIALVAGWRGGPIFPLFTSAAALSVIAADLFDVASDYVMVGAVAAVSVVITRCNVALAFVLSLYVVPLSYALPTIIGALGAVVALLIARELDLLPDPAAAVEPDPGAAEVPVE